MIKRRIVITESQLKRILKEDKEYFFDEFKDDVQAFVKDLLDNPNTAKISDKLAKKGVDRGKLINALVECGFLTRKQKVSEVEGENKKKKSVMLPVYTAHMENGTKKLGEVFEKKLGLGKLPSFFKESIMDEGTLFEIEMDDELDEAMAAGASNGAGGTWMNNAEYTAPVKLGGKKDPAYDHTNMVRKSFDVYNPKPKKSKTNESIEEAKDRKQYWEKRWKEQKANGTVPDRSEYWKRRWEKEKEERAKKQKPKRKINRNYHDNIGRLGTYDISNFMDDAMNMMSDNDWGEYFGDHD